MNGKLWGVEFFPDAVRHQLEEIGTEERGREAVDGFFRFIERSPEAGYACLRNDPNTRSRPFHTAKNAYLGLYVIDEKTGIVTCIGVRPIPYSGLDFD